MTHLLTFHHYYFKGTPLYDQLAIMQRRILNLVHNAATVEVDAQDTRLTKLSEKMASTVGVDSLEFMVSYFFSKIRVNFLQTVDKLLVDLKNHPGSLALDCLLYFTENHGFYTKSIGNILIYFLKRNDTISVKRQLDSTSNTNALNSLEGSLAINAYNCDPLPIVPAAVVVVRSLIQLLNMNVPGELKCLTFKIFTILKF